MSTDAITHTGKIKEVEGGKAVVSIISKASCISCSLNSVCSASDVKEKEVVVDVVPGLQLTPGKEVTVELSQSAGTWAVLLGYFFPFLVLLGGLLLFLQLGWDQGLAGLAAIGLLVPYYTLLYLLKGFFRKQFITRII